MGVNEITFTLVPGSRIIFSKIKALAKYVSRVEDNQLIRLPCFSQNVSHTSQ